MWANWHPYKLINHCFTKEIQELFPSFLLLWSLLSEASIMIYLKMRLQSRYRLLLCGLIVSSAGSRLGTAVWHTSQVANTVPLTCVCSAHKVTLVVLLVPHEWDDIISLCLTRTGNYQIHEFDWLKWILKAV